MKHAKRVDGATPLKGNVFCDGSESRKTHALMPACAAWSLGRQVLRTPSKQKNCHPERSEGPLPWP
jgi:hypothetical protein